MENNREITGISWHSGFYGAMELELIAEKGLLEFLREYPLSKEPLRMDMLIIRTVPCPSMIITKPWGMPACIRDWESG